MAGQSLRQMSMVNVADAGSIAPLVTFAIRT